MRGTPRAILPRRTPRDAFPMRLGRAVRRSWLAYIDWRLRLMAIGRLSRMSDRQLKDIGLSRSQIDRAARGEPDQHPLLQARIS
jgi:uncharacterized protein YjiS (DUF1127 family)